MLDIYSTVFQIPVYNGSYGITRDRSYWCRGTKEDVYKRQIESIEPLFMIENGV